MEIDFKDDNYKKLYTDSTFSYRFDAAVVKSYRKKLQFILSANDIRDFFAMRSLNFEKLKELKPYYSIRLNNQWRLILDINNDVVVIVEITDYH